LFEEVRGPSLRIFKRATVDWMRDSRLGMLEGVGITPCGNPDWVVTGVAQYTTCMCGTAG